MAGSRRRGSYSVGRARREQILDVATANFATLGYAQTSMARIASDVGLTGPGLMHYFPTKKHLLVAVAERRFDILGRWALDSPADTDGTGPLRQMMRLAGMCASQPGLIELFVLVSAEAADPTSAAHELYVARYERVVAALTADFQQGVQAGFLRDGIDYEAIARECIAVADGLQLQWVLTGGRIDVLTLIRSHLERLAPVILRSGESIDLSGESAPALTSA
ncbi:TetR/AcrR family transcriptional regulator [Actinoplanes sp. HUAS TT8]|uniref:TetR/AcrR family transcriptional regulator n=1 Tax=Actinoplanes sp. HUAS TT8 TaxID=3447453 RepID=UPI003F51B0C1